MDLKVSAHTYFMMRNSNLNSVSTENQHEILNKFGKCLLVLLCISMLLKHHRQLSLSRHCNIKRSLGSNSHLIMFCTLCCLATSPQTQTELYTLSHRSTTLNHSSAIYHRTYLLTWNFAFAWYIVYILCWLINAV